jgi:hypothetical protein
VNNGFIETSGSGLIKQIPSWYLIHKAALLRSQGVAMEFGLSKQLSFSSNTESSPRAMPGLDDRLVAAVGEGKMHGNN